MALGDALGLGTEFMTRKEIRSYYPEGLTDFSQFIRDMHRSMHTPGKWTNDTEVILRILDTILEDEKIDMARIAHKLYEWYQEDPSDLEAPYRLVIPAEGWRENPIVVSHRTWRSNKMLDASNEALNRALVIGIFADEDSSITELTRRLVNMTHDDTRCVATTAVAALYVNSYLYDEKEPDFEKIWNLCRNIDERALYFIKMAKEGSMEDFHIDDEETWWYTRKSLGIALWALWNCRTPDEILHRLVNAGGDSDTNASLAMMIAGLKFGYDALPSLKDKIIGKEKLDEMAERLSAVIKKRLENI